jgi:hypothetical protein
VTVVGVIGPGVTEPDHKPSLVRQVF